MRLSALATCIRIAFNGQAQIRHHDHILDAVERIARRIGVDRSHGAVVAGVHRLQHVEGLGAAYLADDDAVGAHAQRIADELALWDVAGAFDVWGTRLHLHNMRLL
jgi:hypothetical protein